jgi:hypothetical protein
MTNFQTNGVRRQLSWLTPENAVLVLPIVGGAVLAGIIAISAATPLLVTLRDQKIKLDALLSQQIELPALGQRLRDLSKQQMIRQRQQDLLLSLLSGTNELTTFLTELDQLALTAGVAIETTEPGAIERYVPPLDTVADGAPPPSNGVAAADQAIDPLLSPGLEKRSATITVLGPFAAVLSFLQELEKLQVFVIVSDLQINAESRVSQVSEKAFLTRMSLVLTAYGQSPER